MKLGAESRKKSIVAAGLGLVAIFMVWYSFFSGGGPAIAGPPPPAKTAAPNSAAPPAVRRKHARPQTALQIAVNPLDPRLRLDLLKNSEDTEYEGNGRNIFSAQSEPVIPKSQGNGLKDETAKITPPPPPVPTGPPPPPPIPLKAFGMAVRSGVRQVFLSEGDDVFVAHEGDVVDRRYKVVKINANSVEVQDLFNNNTQTIPVAAS